MLWRTPAVLAVCLLASSAQHLAKAQSTSLAAAGSASQGERLFTGAVHLRNGGPACISCHDIAGIPFPGGGTLGPDLTHAYKKLGPAGTQSAMQTLYFKVMTPIYSTHPLEAAEQADLMAFLQQAETQTPFDWSTQMVVVAALLLSAIFIALTGFLWRDRVKSVRRALVQRATGQGARL